MDILGIFQPYLGLIMGDLNFYQLITQFHLIPFLLTFDNYLWTLRSSQLMQVSACFNNAPPPLLDQIQIFLKFEKILTAADPLQKACLHDRD